MGQGVGGFVYLSDEQENVSRVSRAGRAYFSDSYERVKLHSPINVNSASGGSQLESAPVGKVFLRSESGNAPMWWGGTGGDAPYSGHGYPLYGGEQSIPIPVTNFSAIQIVAAISGQILYPIGFLNGDDVTLSNSMPNVPDITAPFIISTSPVSGISGVALNSDISVRFNENILPSTVVSGVLRLSPAHNVTIFRDNSNPTDVVLRPNVNLSGSTVYFATMVSGTVSDVNGNVATSGRGWPFTTTNAPPPPDVTAPTISGVTPTSGAQSVALDISPVILFSEQMLSGTINSTTIYIASTSGAAVGDITSTVSLDAGDRKTVTVNPNNDLSTGNTYYINVTTGVQDLASNPMAAGYLNSPFATSYNFQQVYHVTGLGDSDLSTDDHARIGLRLTGTCDLKGVTVIPKRVTVRLKKSGSPTGTISITQRRANDTVACTFGTMSAATLTTSYVDYTFTNLTNTEPMDTNDDKILVEYGGGNSSNKVSVNRISSNSYNGAEHCSFDDGGSSYDTDSSKDACFTIYK